MISGEDVSALLIKHFKTPHSYLKKVPKAPRRFRDDKAILYRGTTLVAASFESGLSAGSFKPLVLVTERPGTPYWKTVQAFSSGARPPFRARLACTRRQLSAMRSGKA